MKYVINVELHIQGILNSNCLFLLGGGPPLVEPLSEVEQALPPLIEDLAIHGLPIPDSEEEVVQGGIYVQN